MSWINAAAYSSAVRSRLVESRHCPDRLALAVESEHGIGVADVDGEEHSSGFRSQRGGLRPAPF